MPLDVTITAISGGIATFTGFLVYRTERKNKEREIALKERDAEREAKAQELERRIRDAQHTADLDRAEIDGWKALITTANEQSDRLAKEASGLRERLLDAERAHSQLKTDLEDTHALLSASDLAHREARVTIRRMEREIEEHHEQIQDMRQRFRTGERRDTDLGGR